MAPSGYPRIAFCCALLLTGLAPVAGCKSQRSRGGGGSDETLIVLTAGSLSLPFKELSSLFMRRHPGTRVLAEAAGSRDAARKVSDLQRACDVLGSADYRVVENLLMPRHARFNIQFATNEMTLVYSPRSRFAGRINGDNWHQLLLDPQVNYGRSDPNRDPCGYRTVMLFQLAEKHYGVQGLARRLTQKGGKRHIRPKETDLLALLQVGQIDYMFTYRSVAIQHRLPHVKLPAQINLASPAMAPRYSSARVEITGKRPGETITRVGAPIAYSVTIPHKAPHRERAEAYVDLLLSAQGRAIMDRNGQRAITPPRARGPVPERLRRYLVAPSAAP